MKQPVKQIDARNLSCPAPVLAAKEAVESEHPAVIQVLVDNAAASQNVSRFLASRAYQVAVAADGVDIRVTGTREGDAPEDVGDKQGGAASPVSEGSMMPHPNPETQKIMVMIATDCMGHGDDALGEKLMASFVKTLGEMGPELWRLVFVNSGVKLTTQGSGVLEDVKKLAHNGVHILVCGTCLMHFDLLDEKQVGETTNMLDIVTAMQLADKVINI